MPSNARYRIATYRPAALSHRPRGRNRSKACWVARDPLALDVRVGPRPDPATRSRPTGVTCLVLAGPVYAFLFVTARNHEGPPTRGSQRLPASLHRPSPDWRSPHPYPLEPRRRSQLHPSRCSRNEEHRALFPRPPCETCYSPDHSRLRADDIA